MAMEIVREDVTLEVPEATSRMNAYVAKPKGLQECPGVIVCGEIFGLTQHIRSVADRIAALGYLTVVPDFYHRTAPRVDLGYDEASRARAMSLMKKLSRPQVIADLRSVIDHLRGCAETDPRTGIVGFSLGGHIAYLAATQFDLRAAVCFYGGWITTTDILLSQPEATVTLTPEIARRGGRILIFIGELDHLITKGQRDELSQALTKVTVCHEIVVYPGVKHGFFCDDRRDTFDVAASNDSWKRMCGLLHDELGSTPKQIFVNPQ
jgi:carboxymethylenebutenolidase